jgi:multidrug efflux pump subunit AcrB
MKWDGEWQLTIEMFRDLGLAFAAVLVLIYLLVVGWFQSFKTPLLIMAAIPFSWSASCRRTRRWVRSSRRRR